MHFLGRRVLRSIDELDDPVVAARMHPKVVRAGALRAEFAQVEAASALLEFVSYSLPMTTSGETLSDRVGVVVPLRATSSSQLNGEPMRPNTLHSYGPSAEVVGSSSHAIESCAVSFSQHVLDEIADDLGVEIVLPERGEARALHGDWNEMRVLLRRIRALAQTPGRETVGVKNIEHALAAQIIDAFAADHEPQSLLPRASSRSVRIARRCEDYAVAQHFHGLTIAGLCAASEVSERRVRAAFQTCYRMSPTAYLRVAALYQVRHALRDCPPTRDAVSRVASDFGFSHLSRFAQQYRALFDEYPSATLAGRRRMFPAS